MYLSILIPSPPSPFFNFFIFSAQLVKKNGRPRSIICYTEFLSTIKFSRKMPFAWKREKVADGIRSTRSRCGREYTSKGYHILLYVGVTYSHRNTTRMNKKSIHDGREADGVSPIISSNQTNIFM